MIIKRKSDEAKFTDSQKDLREIWDTKEHHISDVQLFVQFADGKCSLGGCTEFESEWMDLYELGYSVSLSDDSMISRDDLSAILRKENSFYVEEKRDYNVRMLLIRIASHFNIPLEGATNA